MTAFTADSLSVEIHPDREAMGAAASAQAAAVLREVLRNKGEARIILASAPSQAEVIAGLCEAPDLDWNRITVFHMDEYIGLSEEHPASFRQWQKQHFLSRVRPFCFHGIRGEAPDPSAEAARYAALLTEAPIDLVCLGIGENGHIAFNDPPVADFADPAWVKRVTLDRACRLQQVHDGCFPSLEDVPAEALTLTCPALMSGASLICCVPGERKKHAVRDTIQGPISTACPASILRQHPRAVLYLDPASAGLDC